MACRVLRRIDYGRLLDPVSLRKAKSTPGMSGTDFYQSAIHAVSVNNTKKPFDDPRVRRALHLVCNRPVLVEAVKDVAPMLSGGFVYPFSDFATPTVQLAERPGYQADPTAAIEEARQLITAAGRANGLKGVDFLVRESHPNKIWAAAIQAMLKEALHIDTTLRTVHTAVWFEDAQKGNFDLTISVIVSTLDGPVGLLPRLVRQGWAPELWQMVQ
jgi:ABC-type transport system substrate-binding protein